MGVSPRQVRLHSTLSRCLLQGQRGPSPQVSCLVPPPPITVSSSHLGGDSCHGNSELGSWGPG